MIGARIEAEHLGYHTVVVDEPVVGEARSAAAAYVAMLGTRAAVGTPPLCIVSSGETTVHVVGAGSGGRNQEFALALVEPLPAVGTTAVVLSVGTDGVDGPTDAAGAFVSSETRARAEAVGLSPQAFLDDNDAYHFFDVLADLYRTGPTRTNVGDMQIALIVPGTGPVHL
jgi:hydroxypyruvate reductase